MSNAPSVPTRVSRAAAVLRRPAAHLLVIGGFYSAGNNLDSVDLCSISGTFIGTDVIMNWADLGGMNFDRVDHGWLHHRTDQ